jgi:hypothetical protein
VKLPKDTPASIRKALHRKKMMGKHMRGYEAGITKLSQAVAELETAPPIARQAAYENVSKRVLLERAAAARKNGDK